MNNKPLIASSILAADLMSLRDEIQSAESAGVDWHHFDVMDGHFVPNLSFGLPLISAMKRVASLPLDVHIMVSNPDQVALDYIRAGANSLTFHPEVSYHPVRLLDEISRAGAKAGIALNPGTSLALIEPLLPYLQLVNVMSVNPGFGGQKFLPQTLDRVAALRAMIGKKDILIQVDGGVNEETCREVIAAGADVLVAGTAVYGSENRKLAVRNLKGR